MIDMTATEIRPNMTTPCWPFKGALSGSGRPYFTVQGKKILAYRLAFRLMHGDEALPDNLIARHKCDNEICCNPSHIVKGTHDENMNDMKQRERHGLPHHTIRAIRKLGAVGRRHQDIADLYGIGRSTVTEILGGVNYSHVDETGDTNEEDRQAQT
jgi:hypothetical protein